MEMLIIALFLGIMAINIYYPKQQPPVKIKYRLSGIPVIDVTFNRKNKYEMMLDTGCSGTVISANVAKALKVKVVGTEFARLADGSIAEFPWGYIDKVEVGGIQRTDLRVGIADSRMGLLGQDFYGKYKVIIDPNTNEIEFH
ncbi:MAG: retroviral-like aspartic protease family protein [Scytonematopsis contorta HA4267-MV1]|jgi:predicted aspartyl protease|nr:retroviral-like aspartic protease family protein [Scytonematopsis contorta HA4267-MV1]